MLFSKHKRIFVFGSILLVLGFVNSISLLARCLLTLVLSRTNSTLTIIGLTKGEKRSPCVMQFRENISLN